MRSHKTWPAAAIMLLAAWGNAQHDDRAPVIVDGPRGPVTVLPRLEAAGPESIAAGDVRIEMSLEAGFRVYRAHQDGHTRTVYEPVGTPGRRYAYDAAARRFEEVSSTLRVRLSDDADLGRVAASAGALRAKDYPALGWALLQLPPESNPATVAKTLLRDSVVVSAEVTLKGPIRVPQ
ncbi:MAG: hypothetical protein OXI79_05315 [Gammaproteobacteria bacterium]|nr:hypothetical protein [Gammaproteobacteria bacterium]